MRRRTGVGLLGTIAPAVALTLALAGCGSSGTSTKSSSGTAPANAAATTTEPPPTQAIVSATNVRVIPGSATGNSPCEKAAPTPASPGEVGAGTGGSNSVNSPASVAAAEHGVRGKLVQLPLTPAEQQVLTGQMAAAAAVAKEYPTVKDAEAAGYMMSTVYVPCIGAHYTNFRLARQFDPAHPSELLYAGTQPDSKIVGLSYLVWHPDGPPPGFAGPNDHWHQHNANGGLCIQGGVVIAGEESTRQQCAALGGHKTLLTDIWMVHAWVVPGIDCSWGTFAGECPALGGRLGGSMYDPPAPSKS
ncbi:MAG TPA: hypothetical protein VN636_02695 [Acidimicrobiia bacterium]|nr:hypothetical protein [Acidimicrobiia bacterium]